MERLGIGSSTIKQAVSRVGEKALRVKASTVVTGDDDLSRLLGLEALHLGITGKEAGWTALRAGEHEALADVDFDALIARAQDQRMQLEPFRRMAAAAAGRDVATPARRRRSASSAGCACTARTGRGRTWRCARTAWRRRPAP